MGDLGDDIVQAFDMLDIDRGIDIDPGRQQFLDIEIAFGVAAAFGIGMGKLIDQGQRGRRCRMASRSISARTRPL